MKILIGDDHPLFREGIHRLLATTHPGSSYLHASTFDEMAGLALSTPDIDLILSDLQMPGWPGFTGIAEIRRARPTTPVIVVSASESQSDMRQAIEHGASGYIPKSSSVKVMLGAIDLVMAGGIYVPPAALAAEIAAVTATQPGSPAASSTRGLSMLTQRQLDVLNCLREGKSNKQIAYELGLSEGTVKIHVTAIFKSLGVKNRTQAVISASKMANVAG
ncbi:response regulator [Arenibaculum pallidiluteum]|uniref:response regulator n=1 Tax=Arenibaculum pallidiluteum TaxID=2812559 RepID=UPI001A9616D9|nr:response regulator transcription factor [Arenibaculum pallidiluteum]